MALGNDEMGRTYALLHRYLFVTKDDLRLPTAFLLNAQGEIVKAYRDELAVKDVLADVPRIAATPKERLARAMPFEGTFYGIPGQRNYLQYGLELVEQGQDGAALVPFERAAKGEPSAFTLYSLGTLYTRGGQSAKAQAAFARALEVKPDFSEASNGLGALLAQGGNLPAAVARFKIALETTPDYPDALNNLGYALLQMGRNREAFDLYQKALDAPARLSRSVQQPRHLLRARRGSSARRGRVQAGGADSVPATGRRATTWPSCSWPGRTWRAPPPCSSDCWRRRPSSR